MTFTPVILLLIFGVASLDGVRAWLVRLGMPEDGTQGVALIGATVTVHLLLNHLGV